MQTANIKFDPETGVTNVHPSLTKAADWRCLMNPPIWVFNPWTGEQRDARDVATDRFGQLIVPPGEPQQAPALLDKAAGHMRDRAATYDQTGGERSMGKTVAAFNAITGRDLQESEGWLLMQLLKDVRDRQRAAPHADSLEDGIAYAALKAEARLAGK